MTEIIKHLVGDRLTVGHTPREDFRRRVQLFMHISSSKKARFPCVDQTELDA
jgi:hypothetical protein